VVRRELGIVIDGDMTIPGAQTALFFYAFKGNAPHVFKVPADARKVEKECALWLAVRDTLSGAAGATQGTISAVLGAASAPLSEAHDLLASIGMFLVPVEQVKLEHGHHAVFSDAGRADIAPMKGGILMPAYAGTVARVPPPIDAEYALRIIDRMEATLRSIHNLGWFHGDVKSSNIFLDFSGGTWLGDYGTSDKLEAASTFIGGTPAFQCENVSAADNPLRFDLMGLAISVLERLGLLDLREAPYLGWPRGALDAALERVEPEELRARLAELMS
jgi:hypothetical protein